MSESQRIYNSLRRSRLLIRAARIGLTAYRRERDLKRLLKSNRLPKISCLPRLLEFEEQLEATRRTGDTTYSILKHVEVLTALIAEATLTDAKPSRCPP
jgi:uncharacterized protein DUF6477